MGKPVSKLTQKTKAEEETQPGSLSTSSLCYSKVSQGTTNYASREWRVRGLPPLSTFSTPFLCEQRRAVVHASCCLQLFLSPQGQKKMHSWAFTPHCCQVVSCPRDTDSLLRTDTCGHFLYNGPAWHCPSYQRILERHCKSLLHCFEEEE